MSSEPVIRTPKPEDGVSVYRLVAQCPPLDPNSVYCNLLQCSHFADTSVAAESREGLVGFVSGYLVPDRTDTLFIWQVAVAAAARGQGLAMRMLRHILERSQCARVSYLETTITTSNSASWALFESLANKLKADLDSSLLFERKQHFDGDHESEMLVRIGPF